MLADFVPDGGRGRVGGEGAFAEDLSFIGELLGGDLGSFEGRVYRGSK